MGLYEKISTPVFNKQEQPKAYLKTVPDLHKVLESSCAYRLHEVAALLKNASSNHKLSHRHYRSE